MTAADLFIRGLRERGIDWIATLCGHGLDPLFHAAKRAGLRLVDTRNEQTASYIAEGYGALTSRPGVCAVSSGVALANALAGTTSAWFDHRPMLLVSGASAVSTMGMGHFQDLDQVSLARPLTKYSRCIDSATRTMQILDEALAIAAADPRGPVHVMFPIDVQNAEVADGAIVPAAPVHSGVLPADADPDEVGKALAASRSPLVIAGSGVFYDRGGEDMLRFCETCRVPVVTPIWDRGSVDRSSEVFFGVIGAATGGPSLLGEADCILVAGAEIDYRVGYLRPPAVRSDARVFSFCRGWNALKSFRTDSWLAECVRRRSEFRANVEKRAEEQSREGLHAAHIMRAIESVLSESPVLLIDGGSIGQWAHHLLCSDRYPGDWLTCGRSGVVGWGIGGAMAARLAFPKRSVLLLSGDGAFTFNVGDLECAVRQNLPFVAIVADDVGWGITRIGHVRQFGEAISSDLGPIAFDRLAQSLGARGVIASTPEDITRELRRALAEPAVTVIHVPITGGNP
jgi:acetolactate synthase I/II/III large subunit